MFMGGGGGVGGVGAGDERFFPVRTIVFLQIFARSFGALWEPFEDSKGMDLLVPLEAVGGIRFGGFGPFLGQIGFGKLEMVQVGFGNGGGEGGYNKRTCLE